MKKPFKKLAGLFLAVAMGTASAPASTHAQSNPCTDELTAALPQRSGRAVDGSAYGQSLYNLSGTQRDELVISALQGGNIPEFLYNLQPVKMKNGRSGPEITICVMPDYLAIGTDRDYLRVPMGLEAALSVATEFGFILPTTKMSDAIYQQAKTRLPPAPMKPTSAMTTTDYFIRHNSIIESQINARDGQLGDLTAGNKKDLVLSKRMWKYPNRVAIYGWHRTNGQAIQPLSTLHGEDYADYSHGVRLVSTIAFIDGRPSSIYDILANPALAPILSNEGTMPNLRQLIERDSNYTAQVPKSVRPALGH